MNTTDAVLTPKCTEDKKFILVTPGGGEDGFLLIQNYIRGLKQVRQDSNLLSVLVTGPEMPISQREIIRSATDSDPDVIVKEFTDDLPSLMQQADLVVSMAGYNTICEIVSLGKRAVVVPRTKPVAEQSIRAQRFEKQGFLTSIPPDTLSPSSLMEAIQTQLSLTDASVLTLSEFDGISYVAQEVHQLIFGLGSKVVEDIQDQMREKPKTKRFCW